MNPELQKITERLARVESTSNNISEILARLEFRLNTHRHLGDDLTQELAAATVVYPGYVKSDATATGAYFLPTGWTVARTAGQPVGDYTITHNLGTTDYSVVFTGAGAGVGIASIWAISANTFQVAIYSTAPNLKDQDFTFILIPA